MNFFNAYYFQTNIISFILLFYVLVDIKKNNKTLGVEELTQIHFVIVDLIYCLSDIAACIFSGKTDILSTFVLYAANILYVSMPLFFSFFLAHYAVYKINQKNILKSLKGKIILFPLLIVFCFMISTPFTHFSFYIDEFGTYHRTYGAYIIPVVAWVYLSVITIIVFAKMTKSGNVIVREELNPIVYFCIMPFFTTIIQVTHFGLTLAPTGFAISILFFHIQRLNIQISRDELTGLRNRAEFKRYVTRLISLHANEDFFVIMIDVDKFKQINDVYGHIEGDRALKTIGNALREACIRIDQDFLISRYGGDEFVIVGKYNDYNKVENLKKAINDNLKKENESRSSSYKLQVSLGFSHKKVSDYYGFSLLISEADVEMYKDKKEHKEKEVV